MVDLLDGVLAGRRRESFSGEEVKLHDEAVAERLVVAGLDALGVVEEALPEMKMSSPAKYAVAWLVRRNTSVPNHWIKDRLCMGTATKFAGFLKRIEAAKRGEWGFDELKKIKSIRISDGPRCPRISDGPRCPIAFAYKLHNRTEGRNRLPGNINTQQIISKMK